MGIADGVTGLHDVLLSTQSFVQELAEQAARLIADSLSCGITLRRGAQTETVACSDEAAGQVDALQYRLVEGPCLTALAGGPWSGPATWPPATGGRGSRPGPRRPASGPCCPCRWSPRSRSSAR
jgi:hypothetical protein